MKQPIKNIPQTTAIQQTLQKHLRSKSPDLLVLQISNLTDITTGWENDMYAFDLITSHNGVSARDELVLRIYPGDDALEKSTHEFNSIRLLEQSGYPVPHVWFLEQDLQILGRPFVIMERIDGKQMWPVLEHAQPEQRDGLIQQFCELFVRLHTLDWRPFMEQSATQAFADPYFLIDHWLQQAQSYLKQFPDTGLSPILSWLAEHRDSLPCTRPSVVHSDFHPGNILLKPDGSAVVVDWPGLQVTDARFDLAWTLLLAFAYLGRSWRDQILSEYERIQGLAVDQIEVFEVSACARRLFDISVSISEGAQKLGMRPEAVQSMLEQKAALTRVYELLVHHSGIRIMEIERLIK